MSLETATYIDSLVVSNPDGTDARNTADDHIRLIKASLKRTFPMVGGAVSASAAALCFINDVTSPIQAQFNALRDGSATAINALSANAATSAVYAASAGFAASAAEAAFATDALSSNIATSCKWASSASYASFAGSANFATLAYNSNALEGFPAASFAKLSSPQSFGAGQAVTQSNTSGTTLSPNCDATNMFRHLMTGNTTINTPTAPRSGMVITIHLQQSSSGNCLASWSNVFKFPGGSAPVLSTAANAWDVFAFQYDATSTVWRQAGLNVA